MDKLGVTSQDATAVMVDLAALGDVVNGPEDLPDWDAIEWCPQEARVRRLRQRIFKAAQAGDLKQVRNLQKLMLRSRANTLVSVRRVTQRNTGRHTPGVDGQVAVTSRARAELAVLLHRHGGPGRGLPGRRGDIPKKGDRKRVGEGKRGDLGGGRIIKKKKKNEGKKRKQEKVKNGNQKKSKTKRSEESVEKSEVRCERWRKVVQKNRDEAAREGDVMEV